MTAATVTKSTLSVTLKEKILGRDTMKKLHRKDTRERQMAPEMDVEMEPEAKPQRTRQTEKTSRKSLVTILKKTTETHH